MPSHSVNPSPLQPAPAVAEEAGRSDAVPATSHAKPVVAAAAANAGGDVIGDNDLPAQEPEGSDSDATQPGDPLEEPQPENEAAAEGDAEPEQSDGAHIAAVVPEPAAPEGAAPDAAAAAAHNEAGDDGEQLTPESPFAAAKTAAVGRRRSSAAALRAKPATAADPYAFPETQDMAAAKPVPWTRKRGVKAGQTAAPALVVAVPESISAPTTSHEQTTSAPGGAEAGAAATPEQQRPGEAAAPGLEHAESPDQQSQHVPRAPKAKGAAAVHGIAEVSKHVEPSSHTCIRYLRRGDLGRSPATEINM